MPAMHQFLSMILHQQLGRQHLPRRPEQTSRVTDQATHVLAYDQVMATKLVAAYAGALSVIHRARPAPPTAAEPSGRWGEAVDLACGPGHFTLCLAQYLDYARVTGVDLSAPMIETARSNAAQAGVGDAAPFQQGDITHLADVAADAFDLACCTDAAHHLTGLHDVRRLCLEMDRITRPGGLIVLMDLVRLRTATLTERYVRTLGGDYIERGLESFYQDFHASMFAAWTADELASAIPDDTRRWWCQLVPRGLPTVQIVLGLPEGRSQLFLRSGWRPREHPLVHQWQPRWREQVGERWARETAGDCRLVELGLATARRRWIPPAKGEAEGMT